MDLVESYFISPDRIYRIFRIIFVLSRFPEESVKTESASSGERVNLVNACHSVVPINYLNICESIHPRRRRLGIFSFFRKLKMRKIQ